MQFNVGPFIYREHIGPVFNLVHPDLERILAFLDPNP